MKVALSGASGALGRPLAAALAAAGHDVLRWVRGTPARADELAWDPAAGGVDAAALEGLGAWIHLSGEPIAGARWTAARKRAIADSRVRSTRTAAEALARSASRPAFLCASAVGFYGDRGGEWLDESSPKGAGFLADVCAEWERACEPARAAGLRVANLRFGVALDPAAGALASLLALFRLGLGGPLGSGAQYQSWITHADLVAAILHILVSDELSGPVNVVAPAPVTNAELSRALGRVLRRPAFLRTPAFVLRLALGEAADELLLASQRVRPAKLLASGFRFADPELEPALRRLLA
ncbi:MAG TPA: TIGR01777 family oxidoreductase [Myxococcota bacterium]|nr:TIGR01777 family oxidoreductase [Myxococcota bacterium]